MLYIESLFETDFLSNLVQPAKQKLKIPDDKSGFVRSSVIFCEMIYSRITRL